jgi:4a-hydroxytetrahydrobiopterin dehydratase
MSELVGKKCVPCRGGVPSLPDAEITRLGREVPRWEVVDGHHLSRRFAFPDFRQALGFVNRVGELAESEGHHPDVHLGYGGVRIDIWTHKIDGLTESDFILAAKIDELPQA